MWNKALNWMRKIWINYYVQMHGYKFIYSKRIDSSDDVVEKGRLQEIKNAHRKLSKVFPEDARDSFWRRQASLSCICRGNCHEGPKSRMPNFKRDHLFRNMVVWAAFRNFINYDDSPTDETSISALIRFDAVSTNTIDSLAEFVKSSEAGNKNSL